MDAARFDRLARVLAARFDRRAATGLLAGALAGFGSVPDRVAARVKCGGGAIGKHKRCPSKRLICFRGECWNRPFVGSRCYSGGPPCPSGSVCAASEPGIDRCTCPGGLTICGTGRNRICVDTRTDDRHCGNCLNRCLAGVGSMSCCATGPLAPGECVDTQTDERHCGGCRRPCPVGQACLGGRCLNQCRDGFTACSGNCVNLLTDPTNCGACGNDCGGLRPCQNGTCGLPPSQCVGGQTLCNGQCVDLLRDRDNCGSCGNACRVGAACSGGVCGEPNRCKDDGEACAANADCCRFPESACLNLGVTRVCARNCVGPGSECQNNAPGPFCCSGSTCVGGRCRDDQQPTCIPVGQNCSDIVPCCDNAQCFGRVCRAN